MHQQRSERQALWYAVLGLAVYVAPLFVLGPDAHVRIHDNLDSNIAWYRVLLRSGTWFGAYNDIIPQVMNGLPRNTFGTEFSGLIALHAWLPPMLAYAVSQSIVRVLAFLGMYLLLRDHFVRAEELRSIRIGVAFAFAITPFWPSGMLSTLGQPLALWAFLHIREGKGSGRHWLTLVLLPFYSSFVLGFFFFLAAMFGLWCWDAFAKKRWNVPFLGSIALMTAMYLCIEYRLLLSLLWSEQPTSRNEFISSRLPLWRSVRLTVKNFVLGHNHVKTVHTAIILPVTAIAFYLVLGDRRWRSEPGGHLLLWLFIFNIVLSLWYAFWFHKGWQPLKERFELLNTFNFARFHFLRPLVIYVSFALACALLWRLGGRRGRWLVSAAMIGQIAILGLQNEEIMYRNKPSFQAFYAQEQFREIAEYIGEPFSGYRVASIGLHPAIAQFNGFYTLDSYNNFYPLAYKHAFREIIEEELRKNRKLRTYFDTWGGRCYVFVDELGKKYDYRKTSSKKIRKLSLNVEAFRRMGGRFFLSAVPIDNAKGNGLVFRRFFDHPHSAWRVYLYEAIGKGK